MKLKKKGLIIALCCVVAVIGIAAGAFAVMSNKEDKSSYTVKFELCTDLQTTTVLDRTVSPGAFLEEPEVYVIEDNEENWVISGWYREPEFEMQWDFDFDTVESDITLYAKWETKPLCTVNFYTKESTEAVYTTTVRKGLVVLPCDEEFVGREVFGYYTDKEMTQEFDFKTEIEKDTDLYVDISDYVYFDAKMMADWNICGDQSEIDNYEVSVSLSDDEETLIWTSKNGGYLWLNDLELDMHETSIIEVKMREVNDNYSGAVGGYVLGNYTVNGEEGVSVVYGKENTGPLRYSRSAKPDEDGFYTYTYNISNLTPGLIYDVMTGIRLDIAGVDKYTFEIKELKTYVDKYAVSTEAFSAKGINFNGLHLNTFSLMGEAETEVLANGDLRFGGPNGAYIYKKNLDITLGEEQIIRLTAKGDLNGGTIALFFYGEYTQDGKKGVTTDYTAEQRVTFVPGETDADGYTTYTADLSTIDGFKLNKVNGLRIDLYGEGTRTIDMKSLKSYAPTAEEKKIAEAFKADGLDLQGAHFTTFMTMGDAKGSLQDNGDYAFSGPNGVYLYKKNVKISLGTDQKIELKAKGDLKGGRIRLYMYGEYTQNGKAGTTTDFSDDHKWDFVAGQTDEEGYTTYTLNLTDIEGLKFKTIHGLRIDLYGEGTRTIEIASLKSVAPSKEEQKMQKSFNGKGVDFTGKHLAMFNVAGNAKTALLDNGDYSFGGPNGAMIYYDDMEITLKDDQIIEMKAKGDLNNGAIALFFCGDYKINGKAGQVETYVAEHRVTFVPGETDAEGYTTYTADIGSAISGLKYNVLRGLRIDLYGEGTRTIEIKSVRSVAPSKEDAEIKQAFVADGVDFTGEHLAKFNVAGNAKTALLDNGDYSFGGPNGAMIHYDDMEISLDDDQIIELKAKGDLNNGAIALFFCGDYEINGKAGQVETYVAEHRVTFVPSETDADGYTTYTADIGSAISGLKYNVLRGMRIDLYGEGTRTIEIKSVKSVVDTDVKVTYYVGSKSVYETKAEVGEAVSKPADSLITMGHQILGYYSDAACKTAYNFDNKVKEDTNIYVKISDYMYFSPTMLKEFNAQASTYGAGTATTEVVEDSLKFEAVHGSYIYKKYMDLDVSDTQVVEFKVSATVDVSRLDIWLFGTYTKDGQSYTNTAEDVNLRWLITPDTTGEYITYKLDLGESPKASGMVWEKITGIRIDIMLSDSTKTGAINIQSIKAVEETEVLKADFDGDSNWTYTDANGSGTVPAQGSETVMVPNYIAREDFQVGLNASKWRQNQFGSDYGSGLGSFERVAESNNSDNYVLKYTTPNSNNGAFYLLNAEELEEGKSYTISFRYKSTVGLNIKTYNITSSDWKDDFPNRPASEEWKVFEETFVATSSFAANPHYFYIATEKASDDANTYNTYYIDDFTITCGTTAKTEEVKTEVINLEFASESGYSNYWVKEGNGTPSFSYDSGAIKLTATTSGSNFYYYQPKDFYGTGNTYRISYKYKSDVDFKGFTLGFHSNTTFLWYDTAIAASSEWKEYSLTITTAATDEEMFGNPRIGFSPSGEGNVWIDDLVVEKIETVKIGSYTQGIGTCLTSGVAAEKDNVLYVQDYAAVQTAAEIKSGVTYKYTFLMKTDATGSDFDFDVQVGGTKVADVASGALDASAWTEVSGTFTATADATTFGFLRAGEGTVYIDDIVVEKVVEAE